MCRCAHACVRACMYVSLVCVGFWCETLASTPGSDEDLESQHVWWPDVDRGRRWQDVKLSAWESQTRRKPRVNLGFTSINLDVNKTNRRVPLHFRQRIQHASLPACLSSKSVSAWFCLGAYRDLTSSLPLRSRTCSLFPRPPNNNNKNHNNKKTIKNKATTLQHFVLVQFTLWNKKWNMNHN